MTGIRPTLPSTFLKASRMRGSVALGVLMGLGVLGALAAGVYGGSKLMQRGSRAPVDGRNLGTDATGGTLASSSTPRLDRVSLRRKIERLNERGNDLKALLARSQALDEEARAVLREEQLLRDQVVHVSKVDCETMRFEEQDLAFEVQGIRPWLKIGRESLASASGWQVAARRSHLTDIRTALANRSNEVLKAMGKRQQAQRRFDKQRWDDAESLAKRVDKVQQTLLDLRGHQEAMKARLATRQKDVALRAEALERALSSAAAHAEDPRDQGWIEMIQDRARGWGRLAREQRRVVGLGTRSEIGTRFYRLGVKLKNLLAVTTAKACGMPESDAEAVVRAAERLIALIDAYLAGLSEERPEPVQVDEPEVKQLPKGARHPWAFKLGRDVYEKALGKFVYAFDSVGFGRSYVFEDPFGQLVVMPWGRGLSRYDEAREFEGFVPFEEVTPKAGSRFRRGVRYRKGARTKTRWYR